MREFRSMRPTDRLEAKARIRADTLQRRDALAVGSRIEMSLAAAEHGDACLSFDPGTMISGFLPIRSEIDARPLMDRLRARGARLCVPIVADRTTILFRELVRGMPLISTGFGTVGPGPEAAVVDPHLLIMPLAAFDRRGNRIGYGAGHYDRAIERLEKRGISTRRIGLAFSIQEVDAVPAEAHDRRLDAVVTEIGATWFTL
jgi:5-formyltetrahydrofolate cyclo-ligase